jgi:hypothetical protein
MYLLHEIPTFFIHNSFSESKIILLFLGHHYNIHLLMLFFSLLLMDTLPWLSTAAVFRWASQYIVTKNVKFTTMKTL